MSKFDIVMFWKQNDTGLYGRRIDMLIKYLAKRPEIRKIAVFDKPISKQKLEKLKTEKEFVQDGLVFRDSMRKFKGEINTDTLFFSTYIHDNSNLHLRNFFSSYDFSFSKSKYIEFICNKLKEAGISPDSSIFWYYPYCIPNLYIAKKFKPMLSVVDLVDDNRTWPGISKVKKFNMTIHYKKFISLADIVMTNCDNVKKVFHRYNGDIIVIPNGCDLEEPPRLSKNNKIINLQKLMKPVIGYVGNIEKQRFDFNLIQYIAQSHPDWQIVLIGSVHNNNNIIIQQLKQMSNITFLGVIPYPEVKAWIKLFDVAIIPHKDTIQTRLMNPLKLYVYCSLGVPVVTTNIANIDAFKDIIMVANNHKQFVSKIERLLDDNKCYNFSKISDCIIEHSWVNRVQLIIDHITQKLVEIPFF